MEGLKTGWIDIPLAAIVKAPWNYKEEDEELQQKLTAQIQRNGQVESIIVRELGDGTFEVCNGNHRHTSFKELGFETVHAYNLGPVNQEEAMRITVETNETSFDADNIKLGSIIERLASVYSVDELAKTLPYDEEHLDSMRRLPNFDWDQFSIGKDLPAEPISEVRIVTHISMELAPQDAALIEEARQKLAAATGAEVKHSDLFIKAAGLLLASDDEALGTGPA